MLAAFDIPLSWGELLKRTAKETSEDDCFGLAAQLAYYFFLALFPAVLFVLALASFFPLTNFIDDVVRTLRPVAPGEVLNVLDEQLRTDLECRQRRHSDDRYPRGDLEQLRGARGDREQSQPGLRH